MEKQNDKFTRNKRLDPEDPEQFKQLLDAIEIGESFLTKGAGATDSELTVRGKIRVASAIFKHGVPAADEIERSLAELESGLAWAKQHGITALQNEAWWGIYLCNSRLEKHSEAADALIQLRTSLEGLRRGIKDPFKRGGIFKPYPSLFNALCERLQKAGRAEDLLEAIESSKGRVIADRLTEKNGEVVEDAAIYGSVAQLTDLTRREKFHYLTYFVDEEMVYAVLVSKHGKIQAIDPIPIKNSELRDAAKIVAPNQWEQPGFKGVLRQNVSGWLAPLVAWLEELLEHGVVEKGDHICYSSDDDFHNVPLQYLSFKNSILLDWFSLSRVHSAFHLDLVLGREAGATPKQYLGVVVPLRQDMEKKEVDVFLANLDAPIQWLDGHFRNGHSVRLNEATLERIKKEDFENRIVHFSTHGLFPEETKGNPYNDSFLALADEQGLPAEGKLKEEQYNGKLTPSTILDTRLNFENSHVSAMACTSGLAKEGIAGDILGLDWAFIQARASSLISTHWNVSATCAAQFFTLFYQKWLESGLSRATAYRETMLELLRGDHTPTSLQQWAAFSLTGDFR